MTCTQILWDNDGVLVDTEHLYFEACRRILAGVGVELSEALFAEYSLSRGVSTFDLAVEAGAMAEHELPGHHAERDDIYAQLLSAADCAMPGAEEVVRVLSQRTRMGVVTSAKRRHFELTHRGTSMAQHFDFALTREDYPRSKPHPDPYLTALERQQLDPNVCVVVEDTPRGVAAAHAAGLRCIAIPNPLAVATDFGPATRVLKSIGELPDAIAQL